MAPSLWWRFGKAKALQAAVACGILKQWGDKGIIYI